MFKKTKSREPWGDAGNVKRPKNDECDSQKSIERRDSWGEPFTQANPTIKPESLPPSPDSIPPDEQFELWPKYDKVGDINGIKAASVPKEREYMTQEFKLEPRPVVEKSVERKEFVVHFQVDEGASEESSPISDTSQELFPSSEHVIVLERRASSIIPPSGRPRGYEVLDHEVIRLDSPSDDIEPSDAAVMPVGQLGCSPAVDPTGEGQHS